MYRQTFPGSVLFSKFENIYKVEHIPCTLRVCIVNELANLIMLSTTNKNVVLSALFFTMLSPIVMLVSNNSLW